MYLHQPYVVSIPFSRAQSSTSNEQSGIKHFPNDFLFGVATSAYQIEGTWNADNKGLSNWDKFTHSHSEKIANGENGDVGPNSYEFFLDDIAAVKSLNVNLNFIACNYNLNRHRLNLIFLYFFR